MPDWNEMAVVGRIARPHGLRGYVVINPETDFAEQRFAPGATVWTRSERGDERLTIGAARIQSGRPVVLFDGVASIDAAQRLAGLELRIPEEGLQPLEPGVYYEHQLVGCAVTTVSGEPVGTVSRVEGGARGSRLVIEGARSEIQIPLAVDICVRIDVAAKSIEIDPPPGLLELNETKRSRR